MTEELPDLTELELTHEGSVSIDDLPDLTEGQAAFVDAKLAGKSHADALRDAYNTENYSDNALYVQACRLRRNPKINLWLTAAREAGAQKAEYTAEAHINELTELQSKALGGNNYGAAIRAAELKGKVSGHYVDRIRNETPDLTGDALDVIEKLLGKENRDIAARKLGLENVHTMRKKA